MVDDVVAGGMADEAGPSDTVRTEAADDVADGAAERDGEAGGGRLNGTPCAERDAAASACRAISMAAVRVPTREQSAAKPMSTVPARNSNAESERCGKDHAGKGNEADQRAEGREAIGVQAASRVGLR